jgi:hypothetical protein
VLTLRGLATYNVLFFIHLESRRVVIAGITIHLDELWMKQIARNVTMEGCGVLRYCAYPLHDRDTKYTQSFMIPLGIEMFDLLAEGAPQGALPEENHLGQALLLHTDLIQSSA